MGSGLPSVFLGIALAHSTTTFSMVPTQGTVQSVFSLLRLEALQEEASAASGVRKERREH